MYRAQVVAHVAELPRLGIAQVAGIVDGFCRPDPDVAIYPRLAKQASNRRALWDRHTSSSGGKPRAVGRDVAAVHLEVLLLPCTTKGRISDQRNDKSYFEGVAHSETNRYVAATKA